MTGECPPKPIHFILLGHSKEHVPAVIKKFDVKEIVIFTSWNLEQENQTFYKEIQNQGVEILDIVYLDPFTGNAIEAMTRRILETYGIYCRDPNQKIYIALTGGTNLMAISMSLVALIKGLPAHYVLNNDTSDVLEISLFENLRKQDSLPGIERHVMVGEMR
jgi:malate/lactate dehydrogenase